MKATTPVSCIVYQAVKRAVGDICGVQGDSTIRSVTQSFAKKLENDSKEYLNKEHVIMNNIFVLSRA